MLITAFNAALIILLVWLSYRYFSLRESVYSADERYSRLSAGFSSIIDKIEGYKDGHALEVAEIAEKIGSKMGLPPGTMQTLHAAALFHDAGELLIPRSILRSSEKLANDDSDILRTHSLLGEMELKRKTDDFPDEVPAIIRWHHERWDGMGYPDNLAGEEIPLPARIVAIADSISAMRADRKYREKKYHSESEILSELEHMAGLQFDPALVKIWAEISHDEAGKQQ